MDQSFIGSIVTILGVILLSIVICECDVLSNFALNLNNTRNGYNYDQEFPGLGQRKPHNNHYGNVNSSQMSNNRLGYVQNNPWNSSVNIVINSQRNLQNFPLNNRNTEFNVNPGYVRSQIDRWNSLSYNNTGNIGQPNGNAKKINENNQNGNSNKKDDQNKPNTESLATDNELREFSEKLFEKDSNNAAKFVTINFQGKTSSRSLNDEAPLPLMKIDSKAYNIPTIAKLLPLYDNYIVQSNVIEDYTNQEKNEENAFLNVIVETNVMKEAKKFLIDKGRIKNNENFKKLLHEIWFDMYSRGKGRVGSSGFEHVFLGEIKKNQVSGLHNWLYFDREEKQNEANYLGYLKKLDLGEKGAILKYSFKFHNIHKPVGGMFIGTSPEFEMALYSVCFLLRADRICPLKLNGHRFIIRTYTYTYNGKKLIGSAFPEI